MFGWILLILVLGLVPFILGAPWIKLFRPRYSFAFAYGVGFFINLALFHIVAFAATITYTPFHVVTIIYSILLVIVCVISCLVFKHNKKLKQELLSKKIEKFNWLEWILLLAFLFTVGLQMVRGITQDMGWIADDDATYVAMAADVLETDAIDMINPYTGEGSTIIVKRMMQTSLWFPAYLSSISAVPVPVVVHTVQYEQSLLLTYTICFFVSGELFNNRENRFAFLFLVSIFYIFGYHSFYSLTIRLLGPNYHGKAILAISLTPLILSLHIMMLSESYQWKRGIMLAIISNAFVALTLWGIGTSFVIIVIPILLSCMRKNRDWKHLLYILWGCFIPALMLIYYMMI